MHERPDALASLLATIGREADPYQSTRVARALRRVAVRDLERRITGALLRADQDMHNAAADPARRDARPNGRQLVVLTDALTVLRPDARAACLAGCARIVAGRHEAAGMVLSDALAQRPSEPLRGWLSLNLGAALERLGRLPEARAAYSECGDQRRHPSGVAAAAFAFFVALRSGVEGDARRDLGALLDREPSALRQGLRDLRVHYCARRRHTGTDPLVLVRPILLRIGGPAEFIEHELRTAAVN